MQHRTHGNTERGFTLVEVMVSLAAMAIGFVILWGMHFTSLRLQQSDSTRAEALRVAAAVLESERTDNTTGPGAGDTTNACSSTPRGSVAYNATAEKSGRFSSCTTRVVWTYPWEKQVTVTVSWQERINLVGGGAPSNKRTQSVQLRTIYITH